MLEFDMHLKPATYSDWPGKVARKDSRSPRSMVWVFLPLVLMFLSGAALARQKSAPARNLKKVSDLVNELREKLQIPQRIHVQIAPANDRMISVEHVHAGPQTGDFILCFDQEFLNGLNDQDLRAGIAHELGHIWIFSHHPYLQTEALANQIAMRVVDRESLREIYTKLWDHLGTTGNLDEFLGVETSAR